MKIKTIKIKNYKNLIDIEFDLSEVCSVIVGPNAIGKTSIFEAIVLSKAILFPSISNELQLVSTALKINQPTPNEIHLFSLLNDISKPLEIALTLSLGPNELEFARSHIQKYAIKHLQNTNRFPFSNTPLSEVTFLSSEAGQAILNVGLKEVSEYLDAITVKKEVKIGFIYEHGKALKGIDILGQELLSIIFSLSNYKSSYLNYFPAERSLPKGDPAVQIGQANVQQQIQSYTANPQIKYSHIKSLLINYYLINDSNRKLLTDTFNHLFSNLVKGKELIGVLVNENGTLSIKIRDIKSGKTYDIDSMSSGEKNLILTILLMKLTTMPDGIIIFDEPELHLNPGIQKQLLNYIIDNVSENKQLIIATHSPEILTNAYERENCKLFHLISGKDVTPILPIDKKEVFDALSKLGATMQDILFTKGVLYVEGNSDISYLQDTINEQMPGVGLKSLGGRGEIEKEISVLQEQEKKGQLETVQYFILDRDRKITHLKSTDKVKILQWERYCIENYLLDSDIQYDTIVALHKQNIKVEVTRGNLRTHIKELALSQISKLSQLETLKQLIGNGFNIRLNSIISDDPNVTFMALIENITDIGEHANKFKKLTSEAYNEQYAAKKEEYRSEWEDNWKTECDGKQLLEDIYKNHPISVSPNAYKAKLLEYMRFKNTEDWQLIVKKLSDLINN